jgi:hypothetical protein
VFSTYLGGGSDDTGSQIGFDAQGNIFVAGSTGGSFPVTTGDAASADGSFVAKFSPDGKRLLYATVVPDSSSFPVLAVDAAGNAYIGGSTRFNHAFVAKLSPDGSTWLYRTPLAGSSAEVILGLVVDAGGNVVICGNTSSPDLPATAGAFQTKLAGVEDAFVARLDASGRIAALTYLGGSARDRGGLVSVDRAGNVYFAGTTDSFDLPTTAGSFQPAPLVPAWSESPGAFAAKLSPDLHSLLYATYLPVDRSIPHAVANAAGELFSRLPRACSPSRRMRRSLASAARTTS